MSNRQSLHLLYLLLVFAVLSVFAQVQPTDTLPQPTPEQAGDAYMGQQRFQAALEAYRLAPPSAVLWNKMGIASQMMSNQTEALRCYQASLRLNPNNAQVLNNLGTLYDATHDHKRAERMYRKAIKINPHSAIVYKNLGTAQLANRQYKQGWQSYQTALSLDAGVFDNSGGLHVQNPTTTEQRGAVNYYMAKSCVRAGLYDTAIDYLRKAINEGFTNPRKLAEDTEFAELRNLPAFQKLLMPENRQ